MRLEIQWKNLKARGTGNQNQYCAEKHPRIQKKKKGYVRVDNEQNRYTYSLRII